MHTLEQHRPVIETTIRDKYRRVAAGAAGQFRFPTGAAGLKAMGYPQELTNRLPEEVLGWYCGVGNPLALGPIEPGRAVLDVGCGAGVDACLAALAAGPAGLAAGVDGSAEMLAQARRNAARTGLANTLFCRAGAECLPFADNSFDVVLSNGAYNLVINKALALAEAYRVLKPGGRLQLADQMLIGPPPPDPASQAACWFA